MRRIKTVRRALKILEMECSESNKFFQANLYLRYTAWHEKLSFQRWKLSISFLFCQILPFKISMFILVQRLQLCSSEKVKLKHLSSPALRALASRVWDEKIETKILNYKSFKRKSLDDIIEIESLITENIYIQY